MPDQEIIDGLIASYRELNLKVRSASPEATGAEDSRSDDTINGILRQMRDRELRASQAIRRLVAGEHATESDEGEAVLAEYQDRGNVSTAMLLSQFGTARESTLSMVRELPEEVWNQTTQTPRGEMTLKEYLKTLVDRDNERIGQIDALLSKARA